MLQAKKSLYEHLKQNGKIEKMEKKIQQIDDSLLHIKNKMTIGQELDLRTDKIIITFANSFDKKTF